jgi:hypothetical protein
MWVVARKIFVVLPVSFEPKRMILAQNQCNSFTTSYYVIGHFACSTNKMKMSRDLKAVLQEASALHISFPLVISTAL